MKTEEGRKTREKGNPGQGMKHKHFSEASFLIVRKGRAFVAPRAAAADHEKSVEMEKTGGEKGIKEELRLGNEDQRV